MNRRLSDARQWTRPFGLLRPVDEIAVLARRYLHEFGGTREQLADGGARRPAARQRATPAAMMHAKPLTLERLPRARAGSPSRCACSTTASSPTAPARSSSPPSERARDLARDPVVVARARPVDPAAAPDDDELLRRGPAARARRGRAPPAAVAGADVSPGRRRRRPAVRRLQPARAAVARGLRLLRPGRGPRVRRRRRPASSADGCRRTRAAAGMSRGLRPRVQPHRRRGCASSAASRRTRSPAPRSASSRAAKASRRSALLLTVDR